MSKGNRADTGVAKELPYCDAGGATFPGVEFETMIVSTRTGITVELAEVRWSH